MLRAKKVVKCVTNETTSFQPQRGVICDILNPLEGLKDIFGLRARLPHDTCQGMGKGMLALARPGWPLATNVQVKWPWEDWVNILALHAKRPRKAWVDLPEMHGKGPG